MVLATSMRGPRIQGGSTVIERSLAALERRAIEDRLSRRSFMRAAVGAGLSVGLATSLWSKVQAAMPKSGGTLRLGADGGATTDTLDPLVGLGADHPQSAAFATFDTLTEIDATGTPVPSLAESWEGNRDGTWAIRLRQGVEFHDGKSLTAEDVVWSLNQHKGDASKNAEAKQIVGNLTEIRTDGPSTVILKQAEVNFDLPSHLSSFGLLIGKAETAWSAGVGTGPYKLENFEPGVRYIASKFANFYRDDQGHFDSIELWNITDPAARVSGLLGSSLDVIGSPNVTSAVRLGKLAGYKLISVSGTQHYTTDIRTDTDPLSNAHLRNAIKWGVRRQEFVDKILGGFGTIGNDIPLARGQQFYNDQLPQREYDPEKAKWHLTQAGLSKIDLELNTSDGAFSGAVDMGVLMKESLAPIGINLEVKRQPADGYWSNVWMKQPWSASYYNGRPTADWMLTSQYHSSSEWDATYFDNTEFDALLAAARGEAEETKRRELYFKAQEMLWDKGGVVIMAFVNILIGASDRMGHGAVGVSRRLDDGRLARRWWFEG
ncbi:MAG: peptide ABC transporter substrate-binding protein [Rhizobiales bacterium]|nr:peptide ABC transporter substrate-binding protein [Hyphomicrobiales bacterium]